MHIHLGSGRWLLYLNFLILVAPVQAQHFEGYGLKGGLLFSTATERDPIYTDAIIKHEYKTGFLGGVYADWSVSSRLFLSGVLEFSREGYFDGREYRDLNRDGYDSEAQLDYVSLTGLIKRLDLNNIKSISIFAGPRLDILVHRYADIAVIQGFTRINEPAHSLDTFSFAAVVGVGVTIGRNNQSLGRLEGRFRIDLTDSSSSFPKTVRRNAFDLVLSIPLGK
jgi:hypothetical protein